MMEFDLPSSLLVDVGPLMATSKVRDLPSVPASKDATQDVDAPSATNEDAEDATSDVVREEDADATDNADPDATERPESETHPKQEEDDDVARDDGVDVVVSAAPPTIEEEAVANVENDVIVVDDGNNRVDDLSKKYTQKQLRNLLKANNINSNGSKRDLINRILEHNIDLD